MTTLQEQLFGQIRALDAMEFALRQPGVEAEGITFVISRLHRAIASAIIDDDATIFAIGTGGISSAKVLAVLSQLSGTSHKTMSRILVRFGLQHIQPVSHSDALATIDSIAGDDTMILRADAEEICRRLHRGLAWIGEVSTEALIPRGLLIRYLRNRPTNPLLVSIGRQMADELCVGPGYKDSYAEHLEKLELLNDDGQFTKLAKVNMEHRDSKDQIANGAGRLAQEHLVRKAKMAISRAFLVEYMERTKEKRRNIPRFDQLERLVGLGWE